MPRTFAGLVAVFEDSYVLRVVFTILVWHQLCTSALHVRRSVFCFQEHLLGASQILSLWLPPAAFGGIEEGWETVSVTR